MSRVPVNVLCLPIVTGFARALQIVRIETSAAFAQWLNVIDLIGSVTVAEFSYLANRVVCDVPVSQLRPSIVVRGFSSSARCRRMFLTSTGACQYVAAWVSAWAFGLVWHQHRSGESRIACAERSLCDTRCGCAAGEPIGTFRKSPIVRRRATTAGADGSASVLHLRDCGNPVTQRFHFTTPQEPSEINARQDKTGNRSDLDQL